MRPPLVVLVLALVAVACSDDPRSTKTTDPPPKPEGVMLIAADVALCDRPDDEATAKVLADHPDAVVAVAGDLAYPEGTPKQFAECYDPTWGRFKDRTRPSPGNHEYGTRYAEGYFDYFGSAAGEKGKGWYSYDLGSWHVVSINSNCDQEGVGGCGPESEQGRWLAADLAANPDSRCTLAYWHHPRFSSGRHHSDDDMEPLWRLVVEGGVDVVVNGHDHHYERFAPIEGTRQFVVGTGGAHRYPIADVERGSEVRHSGTPGVLKLTLWPNRYDWKFLPIEGEDFTDQGSSPCT